MSPFRPITEKVKRGLYITSFIKVRPSPCYTIFLPVPDPELNKWLQVRSTLIRLMSLFKTKLNLDLVYQRLITSGFLVEKPIPTDFLWKIVMSNLWAFSGAWYSLGIRLYILSSCMLKLKFAKNTNRVVQLHTCQKWKQLRPLTVGF